MALVLKELPFWNRSWARDSSHRVVPHFLCPLEWSSGLCSAMLQRHHCTWPDDGTAGLAQKGAASLHFSSVAGLNLAGLRKAQGTSKAPHGFNKMPVIFARSHACFETFSPAADKCILKKIPLKQVLTVTTQVDQAQIQIFAKGSYSYCWLTLHAYCKNNWSLVYIQRLEHIKCATWQCQVYNNLLFWQAQEDS